jgi:3D (Asp-Asp-Asp) domain-containing protein
MGAMRAAALLILCVLGLTACAREQREPPPFRFPAAGNPERSLLVTASAYNSVRSQTDSRPGNAAWGDSLFPGLRAIAVSRDLIPMGLDQGVKVRIEGLQGEYAVLDKMDARWRKRIDIYFGRDVKAARAWGEKKVVISWRSAEADSLAGMITPPGDSVTPRTRF